MQKTLKIGGIAVLILLALFGVKTIFSEILLESSTKSQNKSYTGLGVGSAEISGPMVINDSSIRSEKMVAPSSPVSSYQAADSFESQDMTPAQADKKIIRNGNLDLKVDSADTAAKKISDIAKSNGGEILSSNFYQNTNNVKSGNLTVRVPVSNFEKTFNELKTVSTLVVHESISGQDVSEEYVDLKAQLSNRQAEEQSFIRILDQAQKIDDVLSVTRELARVRGNIEQLQGRIKFLESQTDMSAISVNVTEDQNIAVVDSWRPFQVVKDSFNALIIGLQDFVDFIIRFIVAILPILLVWGIIIWILYIAGRKIYIKIKSGENR